MILRSILFYSSWYLLEFISAVYVTDIKQYGLFMVPYDMFRSGAHFTNVFAIVIQFRKLDFVLLIVPKINATKFCTCMCKIVYRSLYYETRQKSPISNSNYDGKYHSSNQVQIISRQQKANTVKLVYNDHLVGYFSAFRSSSRWPRAT